MQKTAARPQTKKTAPKKSAPKTTSKKTASKAKVASKAAPKKTTSVTKTTRTTTTAPVVKTTPATVKTTADNSNSGGGWAIFLIILILICIGSFLLVSGFKKAPAPDQTAQTEQLGPSMAELVGPYQAVLPAADTAGRLIGLQLDDNGQATFTQDYRNGALPIVQTGQWKTGTPDNQIIVTFTTQDDEVLAAPEVLTFMWADDQLTLVDYDIAEWGSVGLTLVKEINLAGTKWQWQESVLGDNRVVTPANPADYTITFNEDGSLFATTDCNNGRSSYTSQGNTIDLGVIASTMMYCADSQEGEFYKELAQTNSFMLDETGNLILILAVDSGSMTFSPLQ